MSNSDLKTASQEFQQKFESFGLPWGDDGPEMLQHIFSWTAGHAIMEGNPWADIQKETLERAEELAIVADLLRNGGQVTGAVLKSAADYLVCRFGRGCPGSVKPDEGEADSLEPLAPTIRVCEGYPRIVCGQVRRLPEWLQVKQILRDHSAGKRSERGA